MKFLLFRPLSDWCSMVWVLFTGGDRNNWNNGSVHSIWWFLISYIGHNLLSYFLFRFSSYIIVPIVPGGVNQLNINQLGPEQSLFHIVPHCSGPKWLIINGLDVFHWGDRNNGTIVSPTFLGGPVEIFTKTMVLSTFGAGVPVIWEQWNNGLTNFWGRGSYSPVDPKPPCPLSVDCGKSSASDSRTSTPV